MEIKLSNCIIRNWRAGDEESLVRHANNPLVARNLRDAFPHPYTMEAAKGWIKQTSAESPVTNFAIEVDGQAVGAIGLVIQTDIFRRSAEIGYWLGEEFWGRGIVTEAVRAVVEYGFATFDIVRIFAGVFERNAGSMRVLEKAGFQFEARMKKAVTKEDHTMDDMIYVIIRD
jgi:RimJ/RimL family protein N-acetyltransferase